MRFLAIAVFLVVAVWAKDPVSYEGYKVYRITVSNERQARLLLTFQNNPNFDFWTKTRRVGLPTDVMVKPSHQKGFETVLKMQGIQYELIIPNVGTIVKAERLRSLARKTIPEGKISFTDYHTYDEIYAYLQEIATNYPQVASVQSIGKSYEGRDIWMLTVSTGGAGTKPAILIEGGIHAREWIAPATVLYTIQEIVENTVNAGMISDVDWYLVPVLNPDGYIFTMTDDRFWRKTRSNGTICIGVDPNRNFAFHWAEIGSSSYECDLAYHGPAPFSEKETSAIRDFALSKQGQIKLYVAFHSYGQYILYPWSYTEVVPEDNAELLALGNDVAAAIEVVDGTVYQVGESASIFDYTAGCSDDWMKAGAGIALSYTIELPGGGSEGFDLPPSRIEAVVYETFEGVVVFQQYIKNKFAP